jgi:DNA-damage-inducible protein D
MNEPNSNPETRVALFQRREIRRVLHNDEWWFAITDIIAALTDSANPSDYWKKLRKRDPDLGAALQGGGTICTPPCPGVRDGRRASERSEPK